jgi:hypothetical protein
VQEVRAAPLQCGDAFHGQARDALSQGVGGSEHGLRPNTFNRA